MGSYSKLKLFSIIGLIGISTLGTCKAMAESSEVNFSVSTGTDPVIELNIPSSTILYLSPTSGRAFNTANLNIGMGTNSSNGVRLFMTPSSVNLSRTSSIVDGDSNVSTPVILPMLTANSVTGYNEDDFESDSSDSDTMNRWGYKLSTESKYLPMGLETVQIASINTPSNATDQDVVVNFAAKVDATQPAGTYSTTLNFTVVANVIANTCNPSGNTIQEIVCMQDITDDNKLAIFSSMALNKTYTLFDVRDWKPYTVSRLADGNIWMTQNLDLDIDSSTTYTPADTDIPANWTPDISTHVTSDTTWDSSTDTPESYDPGDRCWDGELRNNGNGNLNNTTEECNNSNRHYHIGNYYNWTAAVAMNDSSDYIAENSDANQSICPAGWMLPKSGAVQTGSGSFLYLKNQLGLAPGINGNVQNAPVFFTYSGYWQGASYNLGYSGQYWSSVTVGDLNAYDFVFDMYGDLIPQYATPRYYGRAVRCLVSSPEMQDFASLTSNQKQQLLGSMIEGEQYRLKDSRDNKMYYVSKLADGNVWMTQNLDFDIVAGTTYTNEDTDIGWNSSTNSYDAASWAPGSSAATHVTSDTNLTFSDTDPQSYDPGNLCWDGKIRFSGDYTLSNTTEECNSDNVHYHIGNYYNWTAAIAMDNSDDYITDNEDVNRSICPAGWMLPKSGTVQTGPGSFYHLKNQLGLTSDDGGKNTPVFFTYGGFWDANSYAVGNSYGYWSSVVKNISSSYYLYFAVHLLLDPAAESFGRGQYYSVRCLAR